MMCCLLFLRDFLCFPQFNPYFSTKKNLRQSALEFQPVGRWDSRLELLTRYTAQLKGPRHPQFMQGVGRPGLRRAKRRFAADQISG